MATPGTGRLSLPLIDAGAELTCLDISQAMLKKLLSRQYIEPLSPEAFMHNPAVRRRFVDGILRVVDQVPKDEGTLVVPALNSVAVR